MANNNKPKKQTKQPLRAGMGGGGFVASGDGQGKKQESRLKEVERRLSKLTASTGSEDPIMAKARLNAKKFARLVACPDELARLNPGDLPVVPSASTSQRYSLLSSFVGSLTLDNYNMLAEIPGQTLFCARVINTGSSMATGSLLALNMGSSDFTWNLAEVGVGTVPPANSLTKRLVPRFHLGYLLSCPTRQPPPPVVCEFSQSAGTGVTGSVWYTVSDGAGNFNCVCQPYTVDFRCVVICDVTMTAAAGSGSQVGAPISAFSSAGTTMSLTPIFPTTGAPVRSMLQLEGAVEQSPGDVNFFPYLTVASNLRLQSLASALVNKFAVVTYSVGGGREGVYAATVSIDGSTVSSAVAPSWQTIASRSRQHCLGMLDPDNANWYAANICTRICNISADEAPAVCDFSYVGTNDGEPGLGAAAYTPIQGGANVAQRVNFAGSGWGSDLAISLSVITNGLTSAGALVPVSVMGMVHTEHYIPPDTGLHTTRPQYYPEASNWLQVVTTYPALARADSFKDYLKSMWGKVKEVGTTAIKAAGGAVKNVLRDAALEAMIAAVSL